MREALTITTTTTQKSQPEELELRKNKDWKKSCLRRGVYPSNSPASSLFVARNMEVFRIWYQGID
jgi:hypothetical protein